MYQQLNIAFLTQYGLVLKEISQNKIYLVLVSREEDNKSVYEILPVQNFTKDRLCSIQAKYNLENEQKKFLEQQLYQTINSNKMQKAKTHLTDIMEYDDYTDKTDVENSFETQHFLMKNRLTKHIFRKTLNIFSLKFKQRRLTKLVCVSQKQTKSFLFFIFVI